MSVFEQQWYGFPCATEHPPFNKLISSGFLIMQWNAIRGLRSEVSKKLEAERVSGAIGSSLAAEVDIYASGDYFKEMSRLEDDLRLVLITSRATVHRVETEAEARVVVTPSTHTKCERCWHYRADVGSDANHPTLCGRCVSNLFGSGEARKYA